MRLTLVVVTGGQLSWGACSGLIDNYESPP
jgi:hypothetical protein